MTTKFLYTILLLLVFTLNATGQKGDFSNYKTLRSEGPISSDFNTSSYQKIEADLSVKRNNLTAEEQKEFTERIHNSVDELLQSGKVTYGDEISQYVSLVAKKILFDDPELFAKLRFYTVKSNITNALSTDQGIIFVTTGLISQLTTEAELAYVLAHEIVHFKEKHAMEWFEFSNNEDVISKMQEMSIYSQEREFEADAKGIDMYLKAGYSKDHMTVLFDVLAYSYLPIDEIPFPTNYFNSAICDIPKKKFPSEKYDIKLDENYDDRRSTHPNIKRRKTKALETADTLKNWGNKSHLLSLEQFEHVRNVARFERLRSDMLDKSYHEAIYTIFILEKDFPNSIYLTRMKAQAWYGLSALKAESGDEYYDYDFFENAIDLGLEGEIATLQKFLIQLSGIETATLAARIVQDCKMKFPEDLEINELWTRTMKQLVFNRTFDIEKYSEVPYEEYVRKAKLNVDSIKTVVISDLEFSRMTKYQKIRNKRKAAEKIAELDSSNYYLYNISDIVTDSNFIRLHEKFKGNSPDFYSGYGEIDEYAFDDYDLTRKERRRLKKERKREEKYDEQNGEPIELSEIVIVDPYVAFYEEESIDSKKSHDLYKTFNAAVAEIVKERKLQATTIGRGNLNSMSTDDFNLKCLYLSLMDQVNQYQSTNTFPVDYSELLSLETAKENRKVVFLALIDNYEEPNYDYDYSYERKTLRSRIKNTFKKKNKASLYIIILDPKTQKIVLQKRTAFKKGRTKSDIKQQVEKLFDTRVEKEYNFEMDESETEEYIEE
jgi:hypothetical protein